MKMQVNTLLVVILSIALSTTTIYATNIRITGGALEPTTDINKEAVKIVLNEQKEHAKVENFYIKQMDLLSDRDEVERTDFQKKIIQTGENKAILSLALQIASCSKNSKKNNDDDEAKECIDSVRRKFLGPKPVFGVAPIKPFSEKETLVTTDDPKLLKRVLQIYASKRESLNLLKSELNLVQGLAKLLTGEALDDELEIKIESAALVENSKRQSRETIKKITKLMKNETKIETETKLVKIALEPEVIMPKPVNNTHNVRGPTPWEIYSAKLQHAAFNDTEGLGPNEWNPTRGDRMMHEAEEIDERDENYDTQP